MMSDRLGVADDRYLYTMKTYLPTSMVEGIVFDNLDNKINAIRQMREAFPQLPLKEAKDMVYKASDILNDRIAKWKAAKARMRVALLPSGTPLTIIVRVLELVSSTEADVVPGEDTPIYRVPLMDLELVRE